VQVFFVCGAPKSGTTWIQRMLDAHPQVCCSGEGHFIEKFTIPMAEVVRNYNAQMTVVGRNVYEGKPYYPELNQGDFDEIARAFILSRLKLRVGDPGVRAIGDKTPRYAVYLRQLSRIFPDARFIEIVRDPRDVAVSRLHHAGRVGVKDALVAGSERRAEQIRVTCEDWVRCVRAVADFAAQHPQKIVTVRYADALGSPGEVAQRLFGFLGVDTDPARISRVVEATSFAAQTGRPAGTEDVNAFMRKGVAGDWKRVLQPAEAATIEAACGDLMDLHGVERSA
jgi:hypothetical protein